MDIQVMDRGAFSWALVRLRPGEQFVSEAGALFRSSDNIDIDVTTRQKGAGGLFGGLKRLLAAESFFFSTYTTLDHQPGEIGLAPTLQGEVAVIESNGASQWLCAGGSYLGSSADLSLDTQFQGFRGMLSGESLSFLAVSGQGPLLVTSFGRINKIELDGNLTVDTGHVVAFQDSLDYGISKAGSSWIQSWLAGEGLVLNFSGRGTIFVQSHNPDEFGQTLGPMLPPRG